MSFQQMHFTLPEGGKVIFQYPDCIRLESLDLVDEVLALQLRSLRRYCEKKKAAGVAEYESWSTPQSGSA